MRKEAMKLMSQTLNAHNVNRNAILVRSLIVLLFAGLINATAVLISPLAAYYGWDKSATANVGSTMLTFWPIGAIIGGKVLQSLGGKKVVLLGTVIFVVGLVGSALVPASSPGMLYFTYSCCIGIGNGILYCGAQFCALSWFPEKKGLVTGLCMAVNGGSSAFLAPLMAYITAASNIKVTLITCGVVSGIACLISCLGMQGAPAGYIPEGYTPKDNSALDSQYEDLPIGKAVKTRHFWHYVGCMAFFPAFYLIMFSRLSLFMTDRGIDVAYATLGVSLYNIGNVVGRLGLGLLNNKIGYKKVYICCWVLCMISGVLLITGQTAAMFLIAYVCLGAGFGATNTVYPIMSNTSFGIKNAGTLYGFALLGYMICTQIIPRVAAASINATGTYTIAFVIAFVVCTVGFICGETMPKPNRKLRSEAE